MTLTHEQLDELEARAKALIEAPVKFNATASGSREERIAEHVWRRAAEEFKDATTPARITHLVTVYRAALAFVTTDHGNCSLHRERFDNLRTALGMP